jgi:hypothetical protein
LLEPVYVFNVEIEPVTPSKDVNLPDALDVNVFKLPVVVSIESTRFFVPRVVVATELDKLPILVDILELNVEYPVVPVISICDEPDAIPDGFDAMLSQVVCVIEPLNTYLPSYDDVNCEELDIIPEGIPVNPEYVICDEPDTNGVTVDIILPVIAIPLPN